MDFFSIGTNDLIQYTIAVDRVNERIAHLYEPTHPAILRLIKMVVDAAHEQGIWAGVCGEMASEVGADAVILGLGVDELSAGAALVPRVKRAVQSLEMSTCQRLARPRWRWTRALPFSPSARRSPASTTRNCSGNCQNARFPAALAWVSADCFLRMLSLLDMNFYDARRLASVFAAGFALSILADAAMCAAADPAPVNANPLLTESPLPYHLPPFDKIKDDHFAPAYAQGMAGQLNEIDEIANNPAPVTFDNTIVAMERSGQLLGRVDRIFSNLVACNTNAELTKIETDIAPKLAAHQDAIHLNAPLFARIEKLYAQRDQLGLSAESKFLLERYEKDFVRAGARLSDADKTKLKAMNAQLAGLQTRFTQAVQSEKNASSVTVDTREELNGMPESDIAAAERRAKEEGKEGKFIIDLQNTTGQPALGSLKTGRCASALWQASLMRNSHGRTFDTCGWSSPRSRSCGLNGRSSSGTRIMPRTSSRTDHRQRGAVNKLLADLVAPAVANARKEAADIQAIIDQEHGGFR